MPTPEFSLTPVAARATRKPSAARPPFSRIRAIIPAAALIAAAAAFLALSATSPALAHSLWLETPEADVPAGAPARIDVGFNDGFTVNEIVPVAIPKIKAPMLATESGEIPTALAGEKNWEFTTESDVAAGSYVAWSEYDPVMSSHGAKGAKKTRYLMTAKAVVNVGGASGDFPTKPLGKAALELVPLANPAALKAGGSLPVLVLFDGKPLPRATLLGDFRGFNPPDGWGPAKAFYCLTDKDGKADFLPVKGGLWILSVHHAVPEADDSEASETMHVANVTFRVAE
ncbi:MAG: DUF4198 domain-containing protein [Deltaproteobacteria bacterium]|jgi:uncharacterized GH25 family protein|nr:DUF4198 domain-containing protein [Deltaproteobacteria bacterium]